MPKERNFGLDLLRAIAITLVIVSHCTYLFVLESQNHFVLLIRTLGPVGVELFFVLSGFLIGGLLLKEIEKHRVKFSHLITFWKRRWLRTLPNYFLVLLINILLFWIYTQDFTDSIGLYLIFLQNFSEPHPEFFPEAWSLSIEEYAYLILPAAMFSVFLVTKMRRKSVFFWATLATILMLLLFKIQFYNEADIVNYKDWSAGYKTVVIYRLDAIYLGFILVYLIQRFPEFFKKLKYLFLFLGIFVFTGIHFLIFKMQLQPQTDLAFYVFVYLNTITISCAMVFPYAIHMKCSSIFNGMVYFVSSRSYAIYLINFSAILLSIRHFIDIDSISMFMKGILCILYLTLTISLSNIIYLYFEKPILRYRDKNF